MTAVTLCTIHYLIVYDIVVVWPLIGDVVIFLIVSSRHFVEPEMKGSATLATITCQHKITRTRDAVPYLKPSSFFFSNFIKTGYSYCHTHSTWTFNLITYAKATYNDGWCHITLSKGFEILRDPIRPLRTYCGVLSKWEFFIKMRAASLAPILPRVMM